MYDNKILIFFYDVFNLPGDSKLDIDIKTPLISHALDLIGVTNARKRAFLSVRKTIDLSLYIYI